MKRKRKREPARRRPAALDCDHISDRPIAIIQKESRIVAAGRRLGLRSDSSECRRGGTSSDWFDLAVHPAFVEATICASRPTRTVLVMDPGLGIQGSITTHSLQRPADVVQGCGNRYDESKRQVTVEEAEQAPIANSIRTSTSFHIKNTLL
jgi:hypothetical protein